MADEKPERNRELKVFSPSRTRVWDRCALLQSLEHDGWVPKHASPKMIGGWVGRAFAEATAAVHGKRPPRETKPIRMSYAGLR